MDRISITTSPVDGGEYSPGGDDPAWSSPNPASSTPGGGGIRNGSGGGGYVDSNRASLRGGRGGGVGGESFNSGGGSVSGTGSYNSYRRGSSYSNNSLNDSYRGEGGSSNGTFGGVENINDPPRPPYGAGGMGTSTTSNRSNNDRASSPRMSSGGGAVTPTYTYHSPGRTSSYANSSNPITPGGSSTRESQRISELRESLGLSGDYTDEEISVMLRDDDRANEELRLSHHSFGGGGGVDGVIADSMSRSLTSLSLQSRAGGDSGNNNNNEGTRRRRWHPCEPPQTRPGAYGAGIPTGTRADGRYDVGVMDPIVLETRKIDAISSVKETLNRRLGYVLDESMYGEMERKYREEEREIMAASSLRRRGIMPTLPAMMMWDAPPPSRRSQVIKEPNMPELSGPLPFPWTFSASSRGSEGGMGNVAAASPERETNDAARRAWAGTVVDDSPMGP